jgi:hypothetical protein
MPTAIDSLYQASLILRLLCAKNAPLVLGFFHEAFKERNQHSIAEEELELLLDRHLAEHVVPDGEMPAENRAKSYLNLWCSDGYCYIRKRFDEEQQCFVYQLTRHSEKALQWLHELLTGEKLAHTTTESRFSRIFSEMQMLAQQTKEDPQARLRTLLAQREIIDAEIMDVRATGRVKTLEPTQVKDRLIDLEQMVEAFLADFRSIEDRFKEQASEIHEIYLERGRSKGDIVAHALDADDSLRNSEQGKSYYGFRALIRSMESREALARAIDDVAKLAAQAGLGDRVFVTLMERLLLQVTVVQESYQKIAGQLRRVVEESVSQDSHLLMEWIAEIKQRALALRDNPPIADEEGTFIQVDEGIAWANLMEVGFHEKKDTSRFSPVQTEGEDDTDDVKSALRKIGKPLDLEGYRRKIIGLLETREQVALKQVLAQYPLEDGAVDLVGYLCVAAENAHHLIDEQEQEEIDLNRPKQPRFATMNRIIFQRP